MPIGRLSPLQSEVLAGLAPMRPRWTLSGGGALAGFHTKHRETRDLDLFWQGAHVLGAAAEQARSLLEGHGMEVAVLQSEPAFARLQVRRADEETTVDLVADPVPLAEPPHELEAGGERILVDAPHQILVNKLCAILGRSELRDLEDIRELLARGEVLQRALADGPAQDSGFSPLTLAWLLRQMPIAALATALGREAEAPSLERHRDELTELILSSTVTS